MVKERTRKGIIISVMVIILISLFGIFWSTGLLSLITGDHIIYKGLTWEVEVFDDEYLPGVQTTNSLVNNNDSLSFVQKVIMGKSGDCIGVDLNNGVCTSSPRSAGYCITTVDDVSVYERIEIRYSGSLSSMTSQNSGTAKAVISLFNGSDQGGFIVSHSLSPGQESDDDVDLNGKYVVIENQLNGEWKETNNNRVIDVFEDLDTHIRICSNANIGGGSGDQGTGTLNSKLQITDIILVEKPVPTTTTTEVETTTTSTTEQEDTTTTTTTTTLAGNNTTDPDDDPKDNTIYYYVGGGLAGLAALGFGIWKFLL